MIPIYSWEIDQYLRIRQWNLSREEYIYISNVNASPQIQKIKYNPYDVTFYMETNDGYNWLFRIKE